MVEAGTLLINNWYVAAPSAEVSRDEPYSSPS